MSRLLEKLPARERHRVKARSQPEWSPPMLATLTDKRFSNPDWIYERKFDGERALAFRNGDEIRLATRNGKDIGDTYPELIDALASQTAEDFIVDGEIVAFEKDVSSFSRLQQRMKIRDRAAARASKVAVYYYLFDMQYLDGAALEHLPLRRRKALLKEAMTYADPLRYTAHRNRDGEAFFRQACRQGWEGVIAKRAGSRYVHRRSTEWLKFKCVKGQELVIGGFTEPQGSRVGFGALLVGYYDNDHLRYAGKVGTGYDQQLLVDLRERLENLSRRTSPFRDDVRERNVTWVSPSLVGEFEFTEWTTDGKLRHPRFLGLRRDKDPADVTREEADG